MGERWSADTETLVAKTLAEHTLTYDYYDVPDGWIWTCACDLPTAAPQKLYAEAVALAVDHQTLEVLTALADGGKLREVTE